MDNNNEGAIQLLVVDDDDTVRELLVDYLTPHGFGIREARNGEQMRSAIADSQPDLILLDVGLPGEDGLSLARYARENFDVAIIIVSGAGDAVDRIIGLEIGADDYVSKPFDPRELLARIKSVLRRRPSTTQSKDKTAQEPEETFPVGLCQLNVVTRQLRDAQGAEIPLTAMEFDLLQAFTKRPNRPLSRDQLLNLTQNRDWDPNDRSIDIRIARLRKKIEVDPDKPAILKTVRGIGYMFAVPD